MNFVQDFKVLGLSVATSTGVMVAEAGSRAVGSLAERSGFDIKEIFASAVPNVREKVQNIGGIGALTVSAAIEAFYCGVEHVSNAMDRDPTTSQNAIDMSDLNPLVYGGGVLGGVIDLLGAAADGVSRVATGAGQLLRDRVESYTGTDHLFSNQEGPGFLTDVGIVGLGILQATFEAVGLPVDRLIQKIDEIDADIARSVGFIS